MSCAFTKVSFVRAQDLLPAMEGYLVDPASSICLSQRLSHASLSISTYTVKLRKAHYISYSFFDGTSLHG